MTLNQSKNIKSSTGEQESEDQVSQQIWFLLSQLNEINKIACQTRVGNQSTALNTSQHFDKNQVDGRSFNHLLLQDKQDYLHMVNQDKNYVHFQKQKIQEEEQKRIKQKENNQNQENSDTLQKTAQLISYLEKMIKQCQQSKKSSEFTIQTFLGQNQNLFFQNRNFSDLCKDQQSNQEQSLIDPLTNLNKKDIPDLIYQIASQTLQQLQILNKTNQSVQDFVPQKNQKNNLNFIQEKQNLKTTNYAYNLLQEKDQKNTLSYNLQQALNKEKNKQEEQKQRHIDLMQIRQKIQKKSDGTKDPIPPSPIKYLDDSVGAFQWQAMVMRLGVSMATEIATNEYKQSELFLCNHLNKRQYAKNMCHNCYHRKGKSKMASDCSHINLPHYSNGLCQSCYLAQYYLKRKAKSRREVESESDANKRQKT